jgi:AcrR family transcriptional regulator
MVILDAAAQEFAKKGYAGASIRGIAARGQVHPSLLRYYYQSKGELHEAVIDRAMSGLKAMGEAAVAAGAFKGIEDGLVVLLDGYIAYLRSDSIFPRLIQRGLMDGDPALADLSRRYLRPVLERIQSAMPAHVGRDEVTQLAIDIWGMAISYFLYAPMLDPLLGEDPLGEAAVARRREHLVRVSRRLIGDLMARPG